MKQTHLGKRRKRGSRGPEVNMSVSRIPATATTVRMEGEGERERERDSLKTSLNHITVEECATAVTKEEGGKEGGKEGGREGVPIIVSP
jgi:hypothetical protein